MKIIIFLFISLFGTSCLCFAGMPGEYPDLKTYSGGDGPYNRGGYSPKGMGGVITPSGVYWQQVPDVNFNEYNDLNEELDIDPMESDDYPYND